MTLAPIILFVYNRPWHIRQTVEALQKNDLAAESQLFIYADGEKTENDTKVKEVRDYIKTITGFKKVTIIKRDKNWGLAANVVDGVTTVTNEFGKIIVLEDDILTSPYFLTYCNEGLELYKNDANVFSINAYQFPLKTNIIDTFLCPLATSSWGWATWKDKWSSFTPEIKHKDLLQNHPFIKAKFNFADNDFSTMLDNPKSWAIKWYYSAFIQNGLGLFPTKSLVANIGFDGSGENCGDIKSTQLIFSEKINLSKKNEINLELYSKFLDVKTNNNKVKKKYLYYIKRIKSRFKILFTF